MVFLFSFFFRRLCVSMLALLFSIPPVSFLHFYFRDLAAVVTVYKLCLKGVYDVST